jgi:hypothetical protein
MEGQLFRMTGYIYARILAGRTAGKPVPMSKAKRGFRKVSFTMKSGEFQEEVRSFLQWIEKCPVI